MVENPSELRIETIAETLEALEETIILRLIDRAQFKANQIAYERGKSGFQGEKVKSLFELRLRYHEEMDAVFGRFLFPEERPFNRDLPEARRKVYGVPTSLDLPDYNAVNLTSEVKARYLSLVPRICRDGDDGQYGSSTEHDVYALQAISRRIHYGAMFVAESKYRLDRQVYDGLIRRNDRQGIGNHLTRPEVEEQICRRVVIKTDKIQAEANRRIRTLIRPEVVRDFYRNTVIPLTKEGEVLYLLHRRRS
jgi:chorismate mutase